MIYLIEKQAKIVTFVILMGFGIAPIIVDLISHINNNNIYNFTNKKWITKQNNYKISIT